MSEIKSPALLTRVSRFIIIHIVFIFIALALVLFYQNDDSQLARHFETLEQKIAPIAGQLFDIMENDSAFAPDHSAFVEAVERIESQYEYINHIEPVFLDRLTAPTGFPAIRPILGGDAKAEAIGLNPERQVFLSEDGNYIHCYFAPRSPQSSYGLLIASPNVLTQSADKDLAYLLVLLFLISALISLLLIYLIHKGIKLPLTHLAAGFARTAEGQEYYITWKCRDPDMCAIIDAFNNMTTSLAEKQKQLKNTNKELIQANKALKESESFLTALIDYSPDAIIVTNLNDKVIIYNQTAAANFGYGSSDMLNVPIGELLLLSPETITGIASAEQGADVQEVICRNRNKEKFPATLVYSALGVRGQAPVAKLYFVKDISESRNYQSMVVQLDRFATRGKMARDIAHEINNYLAVLQGNLELLPLFIAREQYDKLGQKIEVMRQTVDNITRFTSGLSRFSDEASEFRKEDLNQLVQNLIAFVKPQNKFDNIRIESVLADTVPLVEINAGQVQVLLVNLLYNASEALESCEAERQITVTTRLAASGDRFCMDVINNGPLIPQDDRPKLFVQRFSTRRNGAGLGLITCKTVVDNHHGEIGYRDADGRSRFEITLPIAHPVSEGEESPKETATSQAAAR
ncbi:MAG: PAS domain S-box protein [candidate division Zixibacteria bacterium]|nr:PAS domain S-box protein [candidate division Zixibacteria bacterium]